MIKLLTVKELSAKLGISEGSLYNMTSQQTIPFVKIGKRIRFDEAVIDKWISESLIKPKETAQS